jgi:glutathione S-transferase
LRALAVKLKLRQRAQRLPRPNLQQNLVGLAQQLADAVAEAHDTHHPIASSLYYEDQKREAKRRAGHFIEQRLPRFLGYFERVVADNARGKGYAIGKSMSYVDLSIFQLLSGLQYAFPNGMRKLEKKLPRILALQHTVAGAPRIAAYLSSQRRLAFNEQGIFRHYPELDAQ